MKRDYLSENAVYILSDNFGRTTARKNKNRFISWAKEFQRSIKQVIRPFVRLTAQPTYEMEEE